MKKIAVGLILGIYIVLSILFVLPLSFYKLVLNPELYQLIDYNGWIYSIIRTINFIVMFIVCSICFYALGRKSIKDYYQKQN